MNKTKPDYLGILQALSRHQVKFIVVGGVAAVLEGAPVATFDIDVVHARDSENANRLLVALDALEARYRIPGREAARPGPSHLLSPRPQLLLTRLGPLDLLGEIGEARGYSELIPDTIEHDVGAGLMVRVLGLRAQIQIKEGLVGDKNRAMLAVLRRTLEEKLREH